ncbi:M48 family metallopeptidase [Aquibacillus sp. 3ASR75-11]|uniref:M48 family metallopeptidase n=1 Tax=Terrihalobacillus insolitus TaxID=2950438 RepID=A0A9X3WW07_9BACI|nr:M48 family metallopeptidase [Terrihalobacillus insolitus]MDC3425598.1 M48 family metallopeptidase [Terrihalobacillus insolitus]
MKKIFGLYTIYLAIIWSYFLFFYPLETFSKSNYAVFGHAMFFSTFPLEILFLYSVIKKNGHIFLANFVESNVKRVWIQTSIYSGLLLLTYTLVKLPFDLVWFWITRQEGISNQPIGDWTYELGLDFLLMWLVFTVGLIITRVVIKKFAKAWWLILWLIALPIAIFVAYIQPIWIDPLYEDFEPLEESALRDKIETLTEEVGIEDATLLQVNMSAKTSTYNAYVAGIMGSARIVLWDTTIKGMTDEEILFILAHEIGHYVKKHVYFGVAGYIILSFVLFFLTAVIYERIWGRRVHTKTFRSKHDLRAIPTLLLILSILLMLTQPISLYVSRQMERSADTYAIENTKELEPGISAYKKMALQSKSDISPSIWIEWIRYSHPMIQNRILQVRQELDQRKK